MIDDWLSDDGLKAGEIIGWPEWKDCRRLFRLGHSPLCGWIADCTDDDYSRDAAPHVALCLWREQAREWLESHLLCVAPYECGPKGIQYVVMDMGNEELSSHVDYDAALIATILDVAGKDEQPTSTTD